MVAHTPFGSPNFRLVAQGLLALHRLIRDGKDDTPEAEAVRDSLDNPLKALSPTEKDRARWLSEDLYSVSEPVAELGPVPPDASQHFDEAILALRNRDWDRALELLREGQAHLPPAELSRLRGAIWSDAGYAEVAATFDRHAQEVDPTNAFAQPLDRPVPAVSGVPSPTEGGVP